MSDEQHFQSILNTDLMRRTLQRHRLTSETYRQGRNHNDGMKMVKDAWTIALPARDIEGVNVHFEARHRGELQVDVEVFPYEGSIEKDATRLHELRRQIEVKGHLLDLLRAELAHDPVCVQRLGVTTKRLRDTDKPSTLCAVKFIAEHGDGATAEDDAAFVAQVVDHVTPILDRIVGDTATRLARD